MLKTNGVYIVNPFVISHPNVEKWVYDLFQDSKITQDCFSKRTTRAVPKKKDYKPVAENIYVIHFFSSTDEFIKVGITKKDVKVRFLGNVYPYKHRILFAEKTEEARDIEAFIKKEYGRYHPEIDILRNNGSTECFHVDDKEDIVAEITNLINNRDFS